MKNRKGRTRQRGTFVGVFGPDGASGTVDSAEPAIDLRTDHR